MTSMRPWHWSIRELALALLAALLSVVVLACGTVGTDGSGGDAPADDRVATESPAGWALSDAHPAEWDGSVVSVDALPPEALTTLALVADGGSFPYRQDGSTFHNREALLPDRSSGFYREYTVETPGSSDRGARRLVIGQDAVAYYTEDHYASFRFVAP